MNSLLPPGHAKERVGFSFVGRIYQKIVKKYYESPIGSMAQRLKYH